MSLDRFHEAQSRAYSHALEEMKAGRKTSHWIWFVFPQIDGLGSSPTARLYAIRDIDEALGYLRDPVLRARYGEMIATVGMQVRSGIPVETLMGGRTDALKLVSSLTLFREAARILETRDASTEMREMALDCDYILNSISAQGYPPCQGTLSRLGAGNRPI